jgi:glycosyltransferase 2 family protein
MNFIKRNLDYIWPALGFIAVLASFWLLYREFQGQSLGPQLVAAFRAIPPSHYLLALVSTVVAYVALAFYDRIALLHLGVKHISWRFIAACSFTTYALSHNIGASVVSGAMVRYRGYSSKGLNAAQIAMLVAITSLTFVLGEILVGGIALIFQPQALAQLGDLLPSFLTQESTARIIGAVCLGLIVLYIAGSALRLPSRTFFGVRIEYPHWDIVLRQLIAAPAEILGAAGIIYFALPAAGNPGFVVVLAVFIFSFTAALASNAPGGLGVFELVFLKSMPGAPQDGVLAALLLFRLLYLLIPLGMAIFVVLGFERRRLAEAIEHHHHLAEEQADIRAKSRAHTD